MRDALAAAPGEPVARFGDGLLFTVGLRLVIDGRMAQSRGHGIDDGSSSPTRAEMRLWQAVNQLVSLLAWIGNREPPESALEKRRSASFVF